MSVLEERLDDLVELVDGQEPWSHRKRLHELEGERAAALVVKALADLRTAKLGRWREWAVAAIAAIALARSAFPHLP